MVSQARGGPVPTRGEQGPKSWESGGCRSDGVDHRRQHAGSSVAAYSPSSSSSTPSTPSSPASSGEDGCCQSCHGADEASGSFAAFSMMRTDKEACMAPVVSEFRSNRFALVAT